MSEVLLTGMRWGQFASVFCLFGASLFPFYALRGAERDWYTRPLLRLAGWATGLALFSALGWLGCEAVLMSGQPTGYAAWGVVRTVLASTMFGQWWSGRLVFLAGLLAYLLIARARARPIVILTAASLLLVSLAMAGHGADGNTLLASLVLHLLAGGVWVGGLLALFLLLRQGRTGGIGIPVLQAALARFSLAGFGAVLLLIASGSLNTWCLVGSWAALLETSYGQVLLLKLAIFTAMLGLALLNRFYLMPRLAEAGTSRLLLITLALEQGGALLVLGVVSQLGSMLPPAMPGMAM